MLRARTGTLALPVRSHSQPVSRLAALSMSPSVMPRNSNAVPRRHSGTRSAITALWSGTPEQREKNREKGIDDLASYVGEEADESRGLDDRAQTAPRCARVSDGRCPSTPCSCGYLSRGMLQRARILKHKLVFSALCVIRHAPLQGGMEIHVQRQH